MQQASKTTSLPSAWSWQISPCSVTRPIQIKLHSRKLARRLLAKSRWEISTTEDPGSLSKEIARLQKENELMQQLLARQVADTDASKAPGQASSEAGPDRLEQSAKATSSNVQAAPGGSADIANPEAPTGRFPDTGDNGRLQAPNGSSSRKQNGAADPLASQPADQRAQPQRSSAQGPGPAAQASSNGNSNGSIAFPSREEGERSAGAQNWSKPDISVPARTVDQGQQATTVPSEPDDEAVSQQFEQAKAEMAKKKRRRPPAQTESQMDIVFVSAEAAPWSKTGGLGDVIGSLPIALAERGHRVMVVVPRYQNGVEDKKYAAAKKLDTRVGLDMGSTGYHEVDFYHQHLNNVDWVFVDHAVYHRAGNPYADEHGAFGDNVFRYSLLSMAACEAPLHLNVGGFRTGEEPGYPYGQRCLFVANDWHAALVPAYLAGKYRRHGVFRDSRCILAIHNMAHQGVEPAHDFSSLGLPEDWFETLGWEFPSWSDTPGPAFNILKGGILAADRVMTVSQGYAWEMTTAEGGWGLDGILRNKQHVLNGVVNGIDMLEWDPSHDEHTAASYSVDDLSGKAKCKAALQQELGLRVDPDVPLLGYIGRLDWQKGPDCALDAAQGLAQRGCQTIMLGSGVTEYEQRMRQSEQSFPDSFRGWVGFSIPVAHRIIAGCDAILMPSRFEPCGLNQLFAMRYGTIPIAHATGGLRDTIDDVNPFATDDEPSGTGWTFTPPDAPTMLGAVDAALDVFHNRQGVWRRVMKAGMAKDVSWERSAEQYEQIFNWAFIDNPIRYQ